MSLISLWGIIGGFNIIILTYQDLFKGRMIDDRKNLIMMGVTVALLSLALHRWWYYIIMAVMVLFVNFYLTKKKYFGAGDISTFTWSMLGFGYIAPGALLLYVLLLTFFTMVHFGARKVMTKTIKGAAPYFPVILSSFILTCLITGIFWMW